MQVVLWAWSATAPFFVMPFSDRAGGIPIHGLALCRAPRGTSVYRFSCTEAWEVANDSEWPSVEQARQAPSSQYDVSAVAWQAW